MFRKPTEIDSDSASSSSSDSDDGEDSIPPTNDKNDDIVEFDASNTLSLSANDEISPEASEAPSNTTFHGHMIVATLLEELAKTRAAELLNSGSPGASFTRFSPDVQPVAQRMFTQASRMLSSNGILPMAFAGDELRHDRKQYLHGLEKFGLHALQETELPAVETGRTIFPNTELAIAKSFRLNEAPAALMTKTFDTLNLRRPSSMAIPSPHNDMQMSLTSSAARRSRFRSEFQEVKILGKGGFGQVHHVINFVDNQHYAIKRIPLSPKMSKRWQETGLEELDNVLREIRTLARLEHCNIVRYYNAWIENPMVEPISPQRSPLANSASPRKLLGHRQALSPRPNGQTRLLLPVDDGDGVNFGTDSVLKKPFSGLELRVDEGSTDADTNSTVSLPNSEIFTDGRSHGSSAIQQADIHESVYVLHLQMSIHNRTLTTYLSPPSSDTQGPRRFTDKRHCFHIMPSLRLLLGILCGLQYLHTMKIVHRDIKPGNILLSECESQTGIAPSGFCDASCTSCLDRAEFWMNPRIADFGLSAMTSSPGRAKMVGTEFYRPPASRKGKELNTDIVEESLDVFALGIVLFELLWPFSTKMERYILLTNLSQHGRLPESFVVRLDAEQHGVGELIVTCIAGMVEQDPNRRWTCEQVKRCIEVVLRQCQQQEQPLVMKKSQDDESDGTLSFSD